MSIERSYKAEIVVPKSQVVSRGANIEGSPSLEILVQAAKKVARDKGGSIGQSYRDNTGRTRSCLVSVETPDFPLGVGIDLGSDGRVNFYYEAVYGTGVAQSICNEITQNYIVIAVMRAQQQLGFTVRVREKVTTDGRKVVLVSGVK